MYQAHWGLRTSPFRGCVDAALFHQSPTHEEALARLDFLVAEHRRLGLLVGPPGSGKSMLLEVFAAHCRRQGWPVALVSMLDVEPTEMLWLLASQWGLSVEPASTAASLWRAVGDLLIASRYQQLETVVLADDVDQADPAVLQHLARLARFDPSAESRLTVVLAGRNEAMSRLGEPLVGLAELQITVEPWQRADTKDYLTTMLALAGRQSPVFTEPAIDRLQAITGGTPRRVSQLAELALVAGAGANLAQIDAEVVESAYQELGVP